MTTSSAIRFKQEPPMSFKIFHPVSSPRGPLLDLGENRRTCGSCSFEVAIQVVDEDEHAVDNPRYGGPLACLFANLSMVFRTAILRVGGGKHDQSVTCLHLAV